MNCVANRCFALIFVWALLPSFTACALPPWNVENVFFRGDHDLGTPELSEADYSVLESCAGQWVEDLKALFGKPARTNSAVVRLDCSMRIKQHSVNLFEVVLELKDRYGHTITTIRLPHDERLHSIGDISNRPSAYRVHDNPETVTLSEEITLPCDVFERTHKVRIMTEYYPAGSGDGRYKAIR